MKKLLCLCLILCLVAVPALAATPQKGDIVTTQALNNTDTFTFTIKKLASLSPDQGLATYSYHVQQGAATDGTYAYLVMESQTDYKGSLWKVDLQDGSVVSNVYGLAIDHGNDLTYNAKLNLLVAIHNKPNYNTISFIDPNTLIVVESRVLPYEMYAIAYNPATDRYVIGLSGSNAFIIMDGDFNPIKQCTGIDSGLVHQGCDCDDTFIYFPQNSKDCTVNQVLVYDWEGNFVTSIRVRSMQEIESMFHVGENVYIAFNASGSYLYQATLYQEKAGE